MAAREAGSWVDAATLDEERRDEEARFERTAKRLLAMPPQPRKGETRTTGDKRLAHPKSFDDPSR